VAVWRQEEIMVQLQLLAAWAATLYVGARRRVRGTDDQRGDVPGWVMVTVMTAGLVVVIFALFKGKITDAISNAIDSVTNGTK
jgi:Na+/H+ antiporter NhaD/arsenite permease-like protein